MRLRTDLGQHGDHASITATDARLLKNGDRDRERDQNVGSRDGQAMSSSYLGDLQRLRGTDRTGAMYYTL